MEVALLGLLSLIANVNDVVEFTRRIFRLKQRRKGLDPKLLAELEKNKLQLAKLMGRLETCIELLQKQLSKDPRQVEEYVQCISDANSQIQSLLEPSKMKLSEIAKMKCATWYGIPTKEKTAEVKTKSEPDVEGAITYEAHDLQIKEKELPLHIRLQRDLERLKGSAARTRAIISVA